jgi:hypothetical protein
MDVARVAEINRPSPKVASDQAERIADGLLASVREMLAKQAWHSDHSTWIGAGRSVGQELGLLHSFVTLLRHEQALRWTARPIPCRHGRGKTGLGEQLAARAAAREGELARRELPGRPGRHDHGSSPDAPPADADGSNCWNWRPKPAHSMKPAAS